MRRRSWLRMKKQYKRLKVRVGNCEEVHGSDGFAMITKKGPPTLGRLRISGCASHPAGDGSLRYLKPEQAKFAMNAWSPPGRIFGHHLENQCADVLRDRPSSDRLTSSGDEPPIQFEASTVPAHHGIRRHDNERRLPRRPKAAKQHPEHLVCDGQFGGESSGV